MFELQQATCCATLTDGNSCLSFMLFKVWQCMDSFDMIWLKRSMQLQSQCRSDTRDHLEDLATASPPHTLQLGVSVSTHYHCVLILSDAPLLLLLWLLCLLLLWLLLLQLLLRLVCGPGCMGWSAFCRLPRLCKLRLSHRLSSMGAALLLRQQRWPFLMMTKLLMLLQWRQWLPETGDRVSKA